LGAKGRGVKAPGWIVPHGPAKCPMVRSSPPFRQRGVSVRLARMHIEAAALDEAVAKKAFTGVVTVDTGDRRTFERCEGFLHRGLRVPTTTRTRFAVASGSKTFTALAVMRFVEDGRLGLDQPVREILGADLPLIDDAVTIEELLTHTSGIGDYLDEEGEWEPSDLVLTLPV